MKKVLVKLQQGNINQGHFYFNKEDLGEFLSKNILGGSSKENAADDAVFFFSGINQTIESDVDSVKRLVRYIRKNKIFKTFISFYGLKAGDVIEISKQRDDFYHITPLSGGEISKHDDEASVAMRKDAVISRIVRDTYISNKVKVLYGFSCQVCGLKINTPKGPYAEGAHIKPLGKPHNGPDLMSNILCLCPNHHLMFDRGVFVINDDLSLNGIDGRLLVHPDHDVNLRYIEYHRNNL